MLGTPAQHGMIPRAMAQLFAASAELEASGWSFDMKVAPAVACQHVLLQPGPHASVC
jgi:hypothetical protein